jgi:hypothetical protein
MQMIATNKMTAGWVLFGTLVILTMVACDRKIRPSNDSAVERAGGTVVSAEIFKKIAKVDGHKVYVPVYSHVYHMQDDVYNLTNTLSIRNTDDAGEIYITSVKYYDTKGKLLRSYIENPVQLPPLATLEYIIGVNDTIGGSGANFIVEWISDKAITAPVIECVMIGTQNQQGVSFISLGTVLD